MTTIVVNVVEKHGRHQGRLYPARLPTEAERTRMITLVHNLRCRDRLSLRKTRLALESYGVRRSIGWVCKVIKEYECSMCADPPSDRPERAQRHLEAR